MEIKKAASLARLMLTEEEEKEFEKQIPSILEFFEKVSSVNTEGVDPMVTPLEIVQHLREDKAVAWENQKKVFADAPEAEGHFFKVPPVV